MNEQKKQKSLDELVSHTIGAEILEFDFNAWKKHYQQDVQEFTARMKSRRVLAPLQAYLWRTIMKSKITKLAAAVIIIATVLSVTLLDKTVAPAFGMDDVLAAIAKAEWMHMTWEYAEINKGSEAVEQERRESWTSVNPRRDITIYRNGSVNFSESSTGEVKYQEYDAETNVLTTRYRPTSNDSSYTTIADMILGDIAELEKKGAKVEYIDSVFDDNPAKIINVDTIDDNGVHQKISIVVDIRTYLPKRMTHVSEESGRSVTADIVFDYPKIGPTDIYQAGVPHDAEVKVIGHRLTPEFLEAIRPYRAARGSLPEQRIVVEVANENDNRSLVSVIYTSGTKERFEQLKYVRNDTPPGTDDFETILDWANSVKSGELGIQLNDGTSVYCVNRDYFGRWTSKTEPRSRYKVGFVVSGLIHRGWPSIDLGIPVENNYAIENGLLCIETMRQPTFADTKLAESAQKTLYYLDPDHDYICVHIESFRHPVPPPWGNPPKVSRMDFDPYDTPSEPYLVTEVVQLGQTHTGHWYPSRTIITNKQSWTDKGSGWQMREKTFDVRLYLDVNPEFTDAIFDPEQLPHINE